MVNNEPFYSNYGTDEFGNLLGSKRSHRLFLQDDFSINILIDIRKQLGGDSEFVSYICYAGRPSFLAANTKYDDQKQTLKALKQYEQICYSCYINSHSFGVMTTNDFSGIPAFNLGNVYAKESRAITDEVCLGCKGMHFEPKVSDAPKNRKSWSKR